MAITLDPTLATAQDSLERQPIIELISTQIADAIPFDGQYFNDLSTAERDSNIINGSTGQLLSVVVREVGANQFIFFQYTDLDRTFWSEASVVSTTADINNATLAELENGNIGISYIQQSSTTYYLNYMVVGLTGSVVVSPTTIATYTATDTIFDPYVTKLTDNTYMLVYGHQSSSVYTIQKRTSSNFSTWSAQSTITLSGLDTGKTLGNPSLLQVTGDDIFLFFDFADDSRPDGSVISNVYKIMSTDNGATWDTPEKLTDYTEWGTSGYHPVAAEKAGGTIDLVYHEEKNVLFANDDTTSWENECSSPDLSMGTDLHFDPATSKLYVYQIYTGLGDKALCGIVVFDTLTWSVDKMYTTTSSPAYNAVFASEHVWFHRAHGEGKYAAVSTYNNYHCASLAIDGNDESVTEYIWKDSAVYGLTKNIDVDWRRTSSETYAKIYGTWIDSDSERMYVVLAYGYLYYPSIWIGYIDLTETADPATGKYTWHEILYTESLFTSIEIVGMDSILVIPEMNYIVLCSYADVPSWTGRMTVLSLATGGIISDYTYALDPSFPRGGVRYPVYYNGHVYASFEYRSTFSQENYRGMVDIDLATGVIAYHRPSWATVDNYALYMKKSMGDGRIIVASSGYGVAIFDTNGATWELFNNDNLPGFEPLSTPNPVSVEYDAVNNLVIAGSVGASSYAGIRAFDENGAFDQGKLSVGTLAGTWSFAEADNLSQGQADFDFSAAIDDDDVLWTTWTRRDSTEYSVKWDRDVASLDLTQFLVAGSPVSIDWSIDSRNRLNFSLSHGHLFDPNNLASAYNPFLQKGRQVTCRIGEKVSGVDYWQNQGSYIVGSTKLSYQRGAYPTISVSCEDKSSIWDDVKVIATERYDNADPEDILTEILQSEVGMDIADINIPNLENRHTIYHQWIGEQFTEIIDDLLDHFGYIPYIDVNDGFTVKRITVDGSVDHVYTGAEIISFTPNDAYSSFTNRVTVTGEGLYFVEVLYPEELVGSVSGTGGWWENTVKVERIYYSDDHQRKARNPRLFINSSIKDFKILWVLNGGGEEISDEDSGEQWVEISIEFPGLEEVLYASIGGMIALGSAALLCDEEGACGGYMMAFSLMTSTVSYILGQVATYDYEIYAQPVGEEKQTIYADADDIEFQQQLNGQIVNEEITDPFCYTVASCQVVADQELDIVKAQRKRVSFDKVAHLQDEICDRIQVNHPYSGQVMDIFITNLNRTYTQPRKGVSSSGAVIDSITGWRI